MTDSRIKGLYRLSVAERIDRLVELGWIDTGDAELLRQGRHTLLAHSADKMVENAVGVFGLPLAVAPNFIVNGREHIVPMAIEEPSVVAAVSKAALQARRQGGFTAECVESLLIGQVHLSGVGDVKAATGRIDAAAKDIADHCNAIHPRLIERGGGVRDVEVRELGHDLLAVHILVDTRDAMGANLVNSMCEAVAPKLAELSGGDVALRILSNLADRSVVTGSVVYELDESDRDGIVLASEIAAADPYRAATHNKGIMNGIDAVAIATGNDWRAIEAGAHAFAAREGGYSPLATWSVGDDGKLLGRIRIPLKVGVVGGNLDANPGAALGLQLSGVSSAVELAELMAAVGLAQNFAALRALATQGIQQGHMKLHARSVAASAGVPDEQFDEVVAELVAGGDIKVATATALKDKGSALGLASADGVASGKVILFGEHAVVYGKHALGLPIAQAVAATLVDGDEAATNIPEFASAIDLIKQELGVNDSAWSVDVRSRLPLAMGLGSSAAFAVAIARAFNNKLNLGLDDQAINEVAFECEKLAHGTPSGIDNTLATFSQAMLFRNADTLEMQRVDADDVSAFVIACGHEKGHTREQVEGVRARYDRNNAHYDAIFDEMDKLSLHGAEALAASDYDQLGTLMNIGHGLLNAIGVSTPELEGMVGIARAAGASGAKLTGAGGGGSVVAVCPDGIDKVVHAFHRAGYRTIQLT